MRNSGRSSLMAFRVRLLEKADMVQLGLGLGSNRCEDDTNEVCQDRKQTD